MLILSILGASLRLLCVKVGVPRGFQIDGPLQPVGRSVLPSNCWCTLRQWSELVLSDYASVSYLGRSL